MGQIKETDGDIFIELPEAKFLDGYLGTSKWIAKPDGNPIVEEEEPSVGGIEIVGPINVEGDAAALTSAQELTMPPPMCADRSLDW